METSKNLTLLYSITDVRRAIGEMGSEVIGFCGTENMVFIIILKGGVYTGMELLNFVEEDVPYGFIGLNSYYGEETKPSKHIHCTYKPIFENNFLVGKDILIVDDVVQSGVTMAFAKKMLKTFSPKTITTCALVYKSNFSQHAPDIAGFVYRGGEFIVGCGMGLGEKYRNLSSIYTYKN